MTVRPAARKPGSRKFSFSGLGQVIGTEAAFKPPKCEAVPIGTHKTMPDFNDRYQGRHSRDLQRLQFA